MPYRKTHEVKSWPQFFEPITHGSRVHELRINDRDYKVGDYLLLREYLPDQGTYTERSALAEITSMTSKEIPCAASSKALADDHCILSILVLEVDDES